MNRTMLVLCSCLVGAALACDNDSKKSDAVQTAPSASAIASASAMPASSGSAAATDEPVPAGDTRFVMETGKGSFLIDAPLEKIKGMSDEVAGHLDVNAKDLTKSTGTIKVRLSTLKTSTFGDTDKDVAQTEHARNWMEVGNDSSADSRMKYEWATFVVTAIDATPPALADAKDGIVKAKVSGDLTVHGVTTKKVVPVTLTFKGAAGAPTEIDLKTDAPMPVSMKEHDVKPRDKIGGFLNGALDRIGKKIDDSVQVSFEGTSKASMPAQP